MIDFNGEKIMGKKIKIILGAILTIALCCGQLFALNNLVQRKSSDFKYQPFFKQEQNFDVLFMGTSHVLSGICPMELWNDYGIVSYNMGGNGNEIATTYWVLKNALDYTTPQLVVIDCLKLGSDKKIADNKEYVHYSFDAFPITNNKKEAINDLFPEENRQEMLVDFSTYHTRWNDLGEEDINLVYTKEKGAETKIGVAVPKKPIWLKDKEKTEDYTVGAIYLRKMIEECQQRDIKVLLTYLPFPPAMYHQKDANLAEDIANEYGVEYINFLNDKDIINFDTDCFDPDSHLNYSGARKVTAYLGKHITKKYGIQDRRQDENYASWNKGYEDYMAFKFDRLKKQESLDNSLMLLSDTEMNSCIYIKGKSGVLQDKRMVELIKNVAGNKRLPELEQAIVQDKDYFIVVDNSTNTVLESTSKRLNADTSFGKVTYIPSETQDLQLTINDQNINYLEHQDNMNVKVITASGLTNQIEYITGFSKKGTDKNKNLVLKRQNDK